MLFFYLVKCENVGFWHHQNQRQPLAHILHLQFTSLTLNIPELKGFYPII